MKKPNSPFGSLFLVLFIFCYVNFIANALKFKDASDKGFLVTKDQRETVTETEYGQISAVQINDGFNGSYHLQFITLEPNSLFLPVLLHAHMVFYVHTGSGIMSWADEEKKHEIDVKKGDIYRLPSGSVFYIRSNLESTREKLRVYAIFTDSNTDNPQNLFIGPYSTLSDLVLGFDHKVLQSAFQVPQEVLDEITGATKPPAIVHMTSKDKSSSDNPDWRAGIIESIIRRAGPSDDELNGKKKKKTKTFNLLDKKPDFSNCNGWSVAVNNRDFKALKDSEIGVFMVNLTKGAMMGPHWNPRASEISIVTHGQGMISVVCPSTANEECKNMKFKVKEGDIFTVPRFHPMAQMAYNNDSLVFMGFSTKARQNYPQFLAGKSSVFRTLDKDILAVSFNVPNTTIDRLMGSQVESIILECVSCAEEEETRLREEIERRRQEEEAKRREEEEARRREEEERAREREREEEEERRREEERRKQEEAARRREEEAKREEEEAKREEEERQARERQEEKERRQREEEEAQRKREEEEEAARRAEEEAQRRREEEEAQRREEEEAAARREEEEAQRREEEAQRREEEEAAARAEEEAHRREEEEAAAARREEEEAQRWEEEAQRREEEEEAARAEEEAQRKEEEEAAARREEEEAQRREEAARAEEEAQRREKEEAARQEEEEAQRREEEAKKRQEEEEAQRREEEEARTREEEEARRREREEEQEEARKRRRARRQREKEEEERGGGGGERRVLKKMLKV